MELEELFRQIHPDRLADPIRGSVDDAFNTYSRDSFAFTTFEEFRITVAQFVAQLELPHTPLSDEVAYTARAERILERIYGERGFFAAYEIARTGHEGGIYALMKRIAERVKEELVERAVRQKISEFVRALSSEEIVASARQCFCEQQHLLPTDLTDYMIARLLVNFATGKTLEGYPQLLERWRELSRLA